MQGGLDDLLVFLYVTGLIMAKDIITTVQGFITTISKAYLNRYLDNFNNSTVNLLKVNRELNQLLIEMGKDANSELSFIAMFHNGIAKNFLNYSIRFEYSLGTTIMNNYQIKPLSPYYDYLEALLKHKSLIFHTSKAPMFISGSENKLVYIAPLYTIKKTVISNTEKNLCGCLVIILPDNFDNKVELDTKLIEIQRIISNNPDLVY